MTMTNKQLEEAVALIFELDAKRTPGDWRTSPYSDSRVFWEGSREALASCNEGIIFTEYPAEDNAAFIATAPLMVQVIRQLWAERERQTKPVEVWELAEHLWRVSHPLKIQMSFAEFCESLTNKGQWKGYYPDRDMRKRRLATKRDILARTRAILSRYNVTVKEEV